MNNQFTTIILDGNNIREKDELINYLEENYNLIPGEKTGVRKQIDILKQALDMIDETDIKNSIYHFKVAKLKFDYFAIRNNREKFGEFIKKALNKFEVDLINISNIKDAHIKRKLLYKAKKVFKEFLNGVIIKSYKPKKI